MAEKRKLTGISKRTALNRKKYDLPSNEELYNLLPEQCRFSVHSPPPQSLQNPTTALDEGTSYPAAHGSTEQIDDNTKIALELLDYDETQNLKWSIATDAAFKENLNEQPDDSYDFLPIDDSADIQENLWKLPEEVQSAVQPDWIEDSLYEMLDIDPNEELDFDDPNEASFYDNHELKSHVIELIMAAMYLKHGFSRSALEDQLKLLRIAAPSLAGDFIRSPYLFLKKYDAMKMGLRKKFLCQTCCVELKYNPKNGNPIKDQPCGHRFVKENACYALFLPVEPQLEFYIRNYHKKRLIPPNDDLIGDVESGERFKKYRLKGLIDEHTITIQLNVDGAQIFKSSKFSFMPCMGVINEAPYKIRRSNVLLLALWFGNKKPSPSHFLEEIVETLKRLTTTGIFVDGKLWKLRLTVITVDTIARPMLSCTTQFNGLYGCDFCLNPGFMIKKGRGNVRSYRIPWLSEEMHTLRSTTQHIKDLEVLLNARISGDLKESDQIHGIFGASPFLDLPDLDFIEAFIPDYLHCVCLGVIRYLMLLWITAKREDLWYIEKHNIQLLNKRLESTKPPHEISRCPQTLDNIKFWKASEFRAFALYCFPILDGILPPAFYNNFCDLCYGLYILLQETVPKDSVRKVAALFERFVRDVEALYGPQYVTYNIHMLIHLSNAVLEWGCLWAHSTFIPEWFNGELGSMVNGTQSVIEQMASSFLMKNELRNQAISLLKDYEIPKEAYDLLHSLLNLPSGSHKTFKLMKGFKLNESMKLNGKPVVVSLNDEQNAAVHSAIARLGFQTSQPIIDDWQSFPRLVLSNASIFTTLSYKRSSKRINYCSLMCDENFVFIESFLFHPDIPATCFVLCRILGSQSKETLIPYKINEVEFDKIAGLTMRFVGTTGSLVAYDAKEILKKSVVSCYNSISDSGTVTALSNCLESD